MVKVKYKGHRSPCRVRVLGVVYDNWTKKEVKDLPTHLAKAITKNPEFVLVKGEEIIEEESEEVEEGMNVKETLEFVENATKDQLLDFTAIHSIEADYNESKNSLKNKIKEYLEE